MKGSDNSKSKQAKGAVWYHGGCADGFTGAYAAWQHYGDRVSYSPIIWGEPLPKLTAETQFLDIIDFSLSLADFKACQDQLGVDNVLIFRSSPIRQGEISRTAGICL